MAEEDPSVAPRRSSRTPKARTDFEVDAVIATPVVRGRGRGRGQARGASTPRGRGRAALRSIPAMNVQDGPGSSGSVPHTRGRGRGVSARLSPHLDEDGEVCVFLQLNKPSFSLVTSQFWQMLGWFSLQLFQLF